MSTVGHPIRHSAFQDAMGELLRSGDYSDLTITCGGYVYKVHRAIICPQWHHLGVFISDSFKGPGDWVLDLPNDNPPTIYRILDYLYTQDYDDHGFGAQWVSPKEGVLYRPGPDPENFQRCPIALQVPRNNIMVYLTAEKYGFSSLMSLAAEKLGHWAGIYRRSIAFVDILEEVLTLELGRNSKLRGAIVDASVDHIHELIERDEFVKLTTQFPDFGSEVLTLVVKNKLSEQRHRLREQRNRGREQKKRRRERS
ncbi:hypothetical protein BO78DRAFT_375396 [Aspergillus sclerotiicarbonarius CBS 121057]|uniref:BTB domain-containing protein n=1 Tax=Aspergillus sclerotiicarbonarius (strain CBS 121057 / IBT 28362) TaxID=1448318 RepID=A0A319DZR4_ASPSB|nr:hypothetical protein BO78DRAFT_375396 [Aspergillus sclerotiicarbonarius CBS 121057]